jgi:hypothetical protein
LSIAGVSCRAARINGGAGCQSALTFLRLGNISQSRFPQRRQRTNAAAFAGFGAGIGKYGPSQSEVVIELDRLDVAQVYAYGGFSSDRVEIATRMLGHPPSPAEHALFNETARRGGAKFGPEWIGEAAVRRVMQRMQPHIERLRALKRLQDAAKMAKAPPS